MVQNAVVRFLLYAALVFMVLIVAGWMCVLLYLAMRIPWPT